MTGADTDAYGRLRAVFLAFIMVTSVMGGVVAFSGSAAAANAQVGNSSSTSISQNQVAISSTNDITVELEASDINTSGDGPAIFSLQFDNPDAVDLSSAQVSNAGVTTGNATAGSTNTDDTNDVVNVTVEDAGGSNSETVILEYTLTNVKAADSSTTSDVSFGVDFNANGNFDDTANSDDPPQTFTTLTVGQGNNATADTFIRADVTDLNGDTVTTANSGLGINFINNDSDSVVAEDIVINDNGKTRSINVQDSINYTAELNQTSTAEVASAGVVNPSAGQTEEIAVTINRSLFTDQLEVVNTNPDDANTDVDSDVRFDVQANDTNQLSDGPTGPVPGENLTATVVSASNDSAVNITPSQTNTNTSGIASFDVNSSVPQTVTVQFEKTSDASVNTTATASFGAVEGNNTITGEVRTSDNQNVGGATVYAVEPTSNQSLAFNQDNRDFAVNTTKSENGGYVLNGLQPNTSYNVYVVDDEFNRIPPNQTDSDITGFVAKNQTVTTETQDGDTTTADFVVTDADVVFDYRLNVTLTDVSPDASSNLSDKSARIPTGGTVTAAVDVDRKRNGSVGSFEDAPAGQPVSVNSTQSGIVGPNDTAETNTDGVATVTFDGLQDGSANITASTTNVNDVTFTTNASQEAAVEVFGTAEITGQVVNEDQQALSQGQADVELFVRNSTGAFVPTDRNATIDDDGRYNFLNVESGQDYRLEATTQTGDTGTATINNTQVGTTTRDIVVVGAEPRASVTFDDTTVANGTTTVTVDSADLPDGGYVVIHDANLTTDGAVPSVIGNSAYLEPGTSTDITITLERPITENETLIAMAHRDDGDEEFDFVTSEGDADVPYTADDSPVTDSANVTVTAGSQLDGTAAEYDESGDGEIDIGELGTAATDFAQGELTIAELGDVAAAFAS